MAPSLDLPPPTNAQTDSLSTPRPPPQPTVEDVDEITAASSSSVKPKYTTGGLIYPPPDIRTIVDKTASFVARNGTSFEAKIKGDERANVKFGFLNDGDVFNAYYKARIEFVRDGTGPLANGQGSGSTPSTATAAGKAGQLVRMDGAAAADLERQTDEMSPPEEPRHMLFSVDLPNVTAVDLDIIRLTALFVAQRGRTFASTLLSREGRSFQFEFLRPNHSLFGFFNRLVEQYRLVIEPPKDLKAHIEDAAGTRDGKLGMGAGGPRQKVLEEARKRTEWDKWMDTRRKKRSEEEEVEKAAFAEIDWQDFVVVSTVEITEQDAHIDLPVPMSLREVETMTLAQKRMSAMIMEEEGGEETEDLDLTITDGLSGEQAGVKARPAVSPSPTEDEEEMQMDDSDEDGDGGASSRANTKTTSATNGRSTSIRPPPTMKIRKDYQPKTLAERNATQLQMIKCPVCKESIPTAEMDEHVRIELLNPRYREQRADLESRRAQHAALTSGADPSRFLGTFARARTDIFGSEGQEISQARREEEEGRKAKEREKIIWDGHAASRMSTHQQFNRPELVESTLKDYQGRFKPKDTESIGPQGRPDMGGVPTGPATVSADSDSLPAGPEKRGIDQTEDSTQPPAAQRLALESATGSPAPPSGPSVQYASVTPLNPRGAHLGQAVPLGLQASASAPRTLSLTLHLPPPHSSILEYQELPPTNTVSTIRDRVHAEVFAKQGLGASRIKLRLRPKGEDVGTVGKMLNLKMSLADVFTMATEERGDGDDECRAEEIDVIVK